MKTFCAFLILGLLHTAVSAQTRNDSLVTEILPDMEVPDSMQIVHAYMQQIDSLAAVRDSLNAVGVQSTFDAYYYRLVLPSTLYMGVLRDLMSTTTAHTQDEKLLRLRTISRTMARLYTQNPWLVAQTDEDLRNAGELRNDITSNTLTHDGRLSEKVNEVDLSSDVDENVVVVTRRPKFWKVAANTSLKFTQNYYSDNWFQGGVNTYSGLNTFNISANFNNQRKIIWDNNLSAQLGFQTAKNDTRRAFRPTSNSVRLVTKFGYQAWKKIYYSTQVQMSSQIVPNYNSGTDVCNTDFLSPLDMTVSVGMNFNFNIKKFTASLVVAPMAYTLRYVDRDALVTNYGIRPGHNSYHRWGPNVTFNGSWPIAKNVSWSTRIYWFSNLSYTSIDWENTFNFKVNRLISATLYVYPKFDDSAIRYKNKNGKYIMLKEWLSLGLDYSF